MQHWPISIIFGMRH